MCHFYLFTASLEGIGEVGTWELCTLLKQMRYASYLFSVQYRCGISSLYYRNSGLVYPKQKVFNLIHLPKAIYKIVWLILCRFWEYCSHLKLICFICLNSLPKFDDCHIKYCKIWRYLLYKMLSILFLSFLCKQKKHILFYIYCYIIMHIFCWRRKRMKNAAVLLFVTALT